MGLKNEKFKLKKKREKKNKTEERKKKTKKKKTPQNCKSPVQRQRLITTKCVAEYTHIHIHP